MNTLHLPEHNHPSDHELLPDADVPDSGPEHAGHVLPADGDAAVNDGSQKCLQYPWTGVLCLQVWNCLAFYIFTFFPLLSYS